MSSILEKSVEKCFAEFTQYFKEAFKKSNSPKGKFSFQDGDLSQNSRKANNDICKVGTKKFSRPARSPYMNPIENVFNYVGTKLLKESFNRNITFKKFEEYSARVKKTLLSVIAENINKTIESMDNRLSSGG